jgi:hypothetical protein
MKQRKPRDLVEKLDKPLRVQTLSARYSEVVKLRELVKKAQGDGKSSDLRR